MTGPIKPEDVVELKSKIIPEEVFEAFNQCIAQNFLNGMAKVLQDDVMSLICQKLGIHSDAVYKKGYLDIEEIYKAAGWKVNYNKPEYNESHGSYFEFIK